MTISLPVFFLLLLLQAAAHHLDYLYQADAHAWRSWLDLSYRAPKWGLWDFIPHDLWHIVQSSRNLLWAISPLLCGILFDPWYIAIAAHFVLYATGRAAGFTVSLYLYGVKS